MADFYSGGLHFSCKMCSRCCCVEPGFVFLSKNDLLRLCNFKKCNLKEFVELYCRWVVSCNEELLSLKEDSVYNCIFWNNGCSVYEARPLQCRTYPFWSHVLESEESWNEESKLCPGINNGEFHCADEIRHEKNITLANEALKKSDFEKLIS